MVVFTEGRHAAEFILSEANGNRSRDNGLMAASQTFRAGELLKVAAGVYSACAAADAALAVAIAIYPVATAVGEVTTATAIIKRDAEVNGNVLNYPAGMTAPNILVANAALAVLGIVVR